MFIEGEAKDSTLFVLQSNQALSLNTEDKCP
jgi:hypothetical protein